MKKFFLFLSLMLGIFSTLTFRVYVLFKLWNWIVVKIFGIQQLSFVQILALLIILDFTFYRYKNTGEKTNINDIGGVCSVILGLIFNSTLLLTLGYIIKNFI